MIRMTSGNLLDAAVQAVVNTVNTVGVMGKGIALMFKERFPANFEAYEQACNAGEVEVGRMFVTESEQLGGPRWVINFPTKQHWRNPSKLEWVRAGLDDLRRVIQERDIRSIALPPLGAGNGGLTWGDVKPLILDALGDLDGVDVVLYEPTATYHGVRKTTGVEPLTPARALVVEMVRRYEQMGLDCSILEVQKLAWALTRVIHRLGMADPLRLVFTADRYGPYADNLRHLLDKLDGSYLHCPMRLADAGPNEVLHVAPDHLDKLVAYLGTADGSTFADAIEQTDALVDGFQSPLGMETLATVGWLLDHESAVPTVAGIRAALSGWPTSGAAERKQRLFGDDLLQAAITRLTTPADF